MKKLIILILILCPFLAQSQSKSLEKLRASYKNTPNCFDLNLAGNFLGMSDWILNANDDEEVQTLIRSINNLQLLTLPMGDEGIDSKTLAKLRKDMSKEAYEELVVIRDGKDNINMLIKEKDGIISSLVMLIEDKEDLTILDFSGAIDLKNLSLLASKVNVDAEME